MTQTSRDAAPDVATAHLSPTSAHGSPAIMTGDHILSAIEEKRYAIAKREISALLAQAPRKLYYQALNASYLVATAPPQEAADACHAVRKQHPTDTPTLEILFNCYKKLALVDDAQTTLEIAANRSLSEGLLLTWFKKAYSSFDYPSMRTCASALCKKSPLSRTYKFYSAFATYIWSLDRDDARAALDLAILLLAKVQPFQNSDEACLYAKLLTMVGRFSDVVQTIRLISQRPLELTLMYLSSLEETENWVDLQKETQVLLFEEAFNDYDTWKRYIRSLHKLGKSFADAASKVELGSRNSYVANIYLHEVYGLNLGPPTDTYFEVFQTKPCCALDLSNFDIPTSFLSKINIKRETLLAKSDIEPEDAAILLNIEKINLFHGSKVDWKSYSKFEKSEFSDLFLASMIQDMDAGFTTSTTLKYIVQLENLAKKDPENFYIKVWLLNLYSLVNTPGLALETYQELKIKMIQHDVLAYKLNLNPSLKNLDELIKIYRFYLTSEEQVTKFLEVAVKKGLYTKLEDLFTFGKRLADSFLKHLLVANILRMSRFLGHEYYGYFLDVAQDKRTEILSELFVTSDNRDFETDYKFGFKVGKVSLFSQEAEKSTEYIQLLYAKEFLISEQNPQLIPELLKTFERLMASKHLLNAMPPSDQYFFTLYLNLFTACRGQNIDCTPFVEHVIQNADFAVIKERFLAKTTPLSSSANQILTSVSELVKVIKSISDEKRLLDLATRVQKDLVGYIITNPELSFFKDIRLTLEIENLNSTFVGSQMDKIEDAVRDAKFKLK